MVASRSIGWLGALGAVAALLLTGGCGCTEDSFKPNDPTTDRVSGGQIGMEIPAVEVPFTPEGPIKVDVMFLLDDSEFITDRDPEVGQTLPLGAILGEGVSPPRIKTDVAQEVFDDAVDRLLAQVLADHAGTADDYDLAFGVSRFEDYANFVRSGPKLSDPGEVKDPVDRQARPFILNQPILRLDNQLFNGLFTQALDRETPGDGGQDPQDGQAALEALYQLATGSGFDGNDDGDTTDSGAAGALGTQTAPGTSGDVPAPDFGTEGEDDDEEPEYILGDTRSSGNLGGAGWRPDSIRLVVVFSDICTIAMLESDLEVDGPVANTPNASNTPGEPGAGPREQEIVTSAQAFACTTGEEPQDPDWTGPWDSVSQQAYARFGPENGAIPVAPIGTNENAKAAMLQQTVDALNEMDIEVLCIGIRQVIDPGPNKPNLPGPADPTLNEVEAITDPSVPPNDESPFTWMSAMAILTGARDTDDSDSDSRWVPDLPLVYNLQTVNPVDGPVTDELLEDLSDRVGAWIPYKSAGSTGPGTDPGYAYYTVVLGLTNTSTDLALNPAPFALLPDSDPDGNYVSQVGDTQVVRVECYWEGTPINERPDPVRVAWQFRTERTDDATILNALLAQLPFNFTTSLTPAATVPGGMNPTAGHDPADVGIPAAVSGSVAVVYEQEPDDTLPGDASDGSSTVTDVTSGETYFRDLIRAIPAGTSIDTMHGPIDAGDTPYPAP